ncbi:MAG: chemotaxis protein CheW [Alphaproteobacteria bacterium]|nr:chemotaxis protein CheW [Alphaproteobacteria bacterium]
MTEIKNNEYGEDQELVAFKVGDQEYCVSIMSVREIRGWTKETVLPMAPDYVRGVINLRGSVVPIVDLASRLGLKSVEPSARHVIIISDVDEQIVGFVVDAVSDILTTKRDNIQPTPDVASEAARDFVKGVIALDDRMINLIGLDNVLPINSLEGVAA